MMFLFRSLLLVCLATSFDLSLAASSYTEATVYIPPGKGPVIQMGIMDARKGAAFGYFNDTMLATGWGVLEIKTGNAEDRMAMYAAGFLEGVLTAKQIALNAANMRHFWMARISKGIWEKVVNFMMTQDTWIRDFAATSSDKRFSHAVARMTDQMDGLLAGALSVLGPFGVSKADILMLQNSGDLIDLTKAVDESQQDTEAHLRRLEKMSPRLRRQTIALSGMCSALVVVTPGLEDVYMSHVSWFTYSATNRIYKHYNFPLRDNPWPAPKISLSSYAGYLESLDDFYILSSGMVMLQTTNGIFNTSLYSKVTTSSLPAWVRVRVANHLATSGPEWGQLVSKANSGTYNNQYMLIDLKRIQLKKELEKGALTIVEQIPGLVEWSDQTAILVSGHWPSYNVPFHSTVYNLSGYPEAVARFGLDVSYQLAPRAKLFRRDAGKVRSRADMKQLMRSNNYRTDPYADNDATSAICARGDLSESMSPSGCYDGKVTDFRMALNFQSEAISGPTTNNGTLPPFSWIPFQFSKRPHEGLPPVYNFEWQPMKPLL